MPTLLRETVFFFAVGYVASASSLATLSTSTKPTVLVYEDTRYQKHMTAAGLAADVVDIVDCSVITSCNPPPTDIANRTVAVIGAVMQNETVLKTLPKLALFQSAWYDEGSSLPFFGAQCLCSD